MGRGDSHIMGTAISFSTLENILIGKITIANRVLYMDMYNYGV